MRKALKKLLFRLYKPYALWVISADRNYTYKGLNIYIPKGVFHPGLFFSTHFLTEQLNSYNLKEKQFLELGCGSGLLSLYASRLGAVVTAVDINPLAVTATRNNALTNKLDIQTLESDLFSSLDKRVFDYIVINPPYYKKNPKDNVSAAWLAGSEYQYFEKLFKQLAEHINPATIILMVASEDVDIELIKTIADKNGFVLQLKAEKTILLEKNYIYLVSPLL